MARQIYFYTTNFVAVDKDGYLQCLNDWNPSVGHFLATKEGRKLRYFHWELILLVRNFYCKYNLSPSMVPLINEIKLLNHKRGNSIYLLNLFTSKSFSKYLESPARIAARIAGLPKPKNCI